MAQPHMTRQKVDVDQCVMLGLHSFTLHSYKTPGSTRNTYKEWPFVSTMASEICFKTFCALNSGKIIIIRPQKDPVDK